MSFKLNQHRRHHSPKQKHKLMNWREYYASLRRRGNLTFWFTDAANEGLPQNRAQAKACSLVFVPGNLAGADASGRVPPRSAPN